jgi:glycosyltransferase involved in cell wall biosynthesis
VLDRHSGSDDDTTRLWDAASEVIEAEGARALDNERSPGLPGARNTGYLAARGDLIANCDDDDYWLAGKLRAQVSALIGEPDAILVCCGIVLEYRDKLTERVHPARAVTFDELLRSRLMALHASTFLARRSALLNDIGLVSEQNPSGIAEDYELLLRAARKSVVLNVPQALVRVRWHTERPAMYGRWELVRDGLEWLLDRYPEFRTSPVGYGRLAGKIAFACAASGSRSEGRAWARRALAANPLEPRAFIALAVTAGLVTPETVIRWARSRGRGI